MSLIQERKAQASNNLSSENNEITMRRLQGEIAELSYIESQRIHEDLMQHARQLNREEFLEERRTQNGK